MEEILYLASEMNTKRSFEGAPRYNYCKSSLGLTLLSNGEFNTKYELPAQWVQTFLAGESVFYTYVSEKKNRGGQSTYIGCDSSLEVGQNSHGAARAILFCLKKFFKGGYIKPKYNYDNLSECKNSRSVNRYVLRNSDTIINFVDQYPMLTRKQLDYLDWKIIVELKARGSHKTLEGLTLIKNILNNVNSKRDSN